MIVLSLFALMIGCSAGGGEGKKVVVYSPHGKEIMSEVSKWFKDETGIDVAYLTMGGGELVDRIRAEKENPQADVIYGNPSSVFNQLKKEGLLSEFVPTWAEKIDPLFKDVDRKWYGTIQTPVVLFYNHDALSADKAPQDWFDLGDPKYKGQIIFRSTTSAASRATLSGLMDYFYQKGTLESEGWNFFKAMDSNVKKYVSDSSIMFQSLARQEGSISFWTLDGVIDNIEKNKMPFTIVRAKSGSPIITDGVAIINGAKHKDAAQKFVEFVGRADIQEKLANQFNRMPTHPDAMSKAPEWMKKFDYKPMNINWDNLAENQSEWIQYFEDNIRDSAKVDK